MLISCCDLCSDLVNVLYTVLLCSVTEERFLGHCPRSLFSRALKKEVNKVSVPLPIVHEY